MTDNIVSIDKLVKKYGAVTAVDSISFDIRKGTLLSLLGPNGAGKTTTLECMEGTINPDSGKVVINTKKIGIQLQSSALPEHLTVEESLRLFCSYRKIPVRIDLLGRFGLEEKRRTQYCKLSTGQKRRLALALSVIHHPELLFLDEPTSGLDVQSRMELHSIIRELKNSGTTVLLATHDMAEAEALSERIIIMNRGRIAAEGTPAEITSSGNSYTKISLRTELNTFRDSEWDFPGTAEVLRKGAYVIMYSSDIEMTTSAVLKQVRNNGDRLIDLRIERPSLEERFLEIIKDEASAEGVLS